MVLRSINDRLNEYIFKNGGAKAKAALSLKADISVPLIEKIRRGHQAKPENIYRLALAMGISEEEATELATQRLVSTA